MKIKRSQLRELVREIVKRTFWMREQRLDEAQRGEWWIYPGGSSIFADGDVGDSNHEGFVISYVASEIYEHFLGYPPEEMGYLSDYEDSLFQALVNEERMTEEEIEDWKNGDGPTEILVQKLLEDKVYTDKDQAYYAVFIAWGSSSKDSRDYAMKYLGWKRLTTSGSYTEVQTWFLRQNDLDDIRRGIYDAWGDWGEDEQDEEEKHSVTIEVRSNNKVFSNIPIDVLEKASVNDIITYQRQAAWMRETAGDYLSIGHNQNGIVWGWTNDGEFKKYKASKVEGHFTLGTRFDWQGRYDPNKNTISIVDMSSYRGGRNDTSIENIPQNLLRRLKFEFGDNAKLKGFYEEKSSPIIDPVNFTQMG